jgi:hypothetical protein
LKLAQRRLSPRRSDDAGRFAVVKPDQLTRAAGVVAPGTSVMGAPQFGEFIDCCFSVGALAGWVYMALL